MKPDDTRHIKIVRLMEPTMCLSCRFAAIATVEMKDGSSRRMLHCKRLDCDNWQEEKDESMQPRSLYGIRTDPHPLD